MPSAVGKTEPFAIPGNLRVIAEPLRFSLPGGGGIQENTIQVVGYDEPVSGCFSLFWTEREFASAHHGSTCDCAVMCLYDFEKVVCVPRVFSGPKCLESGISCEFFMQAVGLRVPEKNEFSAQDGSRYPGPLFGKSTRPERLQVHDVHGF